MRWMVVAVCLAAVPAQAAEVDVNACKEALEELHAAAQAGYQLSLTNLELQVRIEAHKIKSDDIEKNSEDISEYALRLSRHLTAAREALFPMCLQAAKEIGARAN